MKTDSNALAVNAALGADPSLADHVGSPDTGGEARASLPAPAGLDLSRPWTGKTLETHSMEKNDEVTDKIALFKGIYMPYPRQTMLHSRLDRLRKLGQKTRGRPQEGIRVLAPSKSGKSTTIESYERLVRANGSYGPDAVPVLIVALDSATTLKTLWRTILDMFGDAYSDTGTERSLRKRVYACLQRAGVELLIIDEVQHLNYRSSDKNDVTDALKRLLDDGIVPVAFVGVDSAKSMFTRNVQLSLRLDAPGDLDPLKWTSAEDRKLFAGYVSRLCDEMVKLGVVEDRPAFSDPWVLGCLFTVSKGVIGRVSLCVQGALEIATRRNASTVEVYDLALAVDRWAIPQGVIDHNPFRAKKTGGKK